MDADGGFNDVTAVEGFGGSDAFLIDAGAFLAGPI
jgi:hypothetical protein